MRALFSAILLCGGLLAQPAMGDESRSYDFFLLACDQQSDCQRVANLRLGSDGQQLDRPTSGVNVHVDTLSCSLESATVRLSMSVAPARLHADGAGAGRDQKGQMSFQVESASLNRNYYSPIAVFSGAGRIYQLWGRLDIVEQAAKGLAMK